MYVLAATGRIRSRLSPESARMISELVENLMNLRGVLPAIHTWPPINLGLLDIKLVCVPIQRPLRRIHFPSFLKAVPPIQLGCLLFEFNNPFPL